MSFKLNGNFVIAKTIYLPSNFNWILNGTLTLDDNVDLDEVGWYDPPIDARRPTAITEKSGGATNIEMSGGTYYGYDIHYETKSIRFINFVSVTYSYFHDFIVNEGSDDGFTLGPESKYNECRDLIGQYSHGNALNDKGDHNKWYDCIAEDCDSDGWTPKCRYSEFYRCIGRRNLGPGFGMYVRIDGSGNPDLGETIEGNKFYDCEAYDNNLSGFSFDISSTCGEGGSVRNNYVQGVAYNNRMQGVFFRNKQPNSIIENNEVNIIAWGNLGQKNDCSLSVFAGGVSAEEDPGSPVRGITGSVVCYDNMGWDVNTFEATDCNITAYHPAGENAPVLKIGDPSNTLTIIGFDCSDSLVEWCQQKYCEIAASTPPADPDSLAANKVSFRQINLSWTDNASDEAGFRIERKDKSSKYTEIAIVGADVNSYEDVGLLPSTTYTYRVRAYNIAGYSGYSIEASATTASSNPDGFEEIIYDDFEGDSYGNWKDGGADCKVDVSEHAHQGSYAVNLESNTSTSLVTTQELALIGYIDMLVEFWYKAVSMESGESFRLQISTDGGSNYATVRTWISGVDFENDTFYADNVAITGFTLTNKTHLRFRCNASDDDDDVYLDEIRISGKKGGISAINGADNTKPDQFVLHHNYPNPFNPQTSICYTLARDAEVNLDIYNLRGQKIRILVTNERQTAGLHSRVWNTKSDAGISASSGIYIYVIKIVEENGLIVRSHKMNFIK